MPIRSLRANLALLLMAASIWLLREDRGSTFGYFASSLVVITFWYLNELSFALANLRNILFLTLLVGALWISARLLFPFAGDTARMGVLTEGNLDPALIARLKASHDIALELYFDHQPSSQERYYKVGSLSFTKDGLHYLAQNSAFEPAKFPNAAAWARSHLRSGNLESALEEIRAWFQGSFSYTLAPGSLRSPFPLDEFLFESRQGFCEHFAASLATLLKLRGDKTKVSVGYAGGSWNPWFGRLTYEESDAHAWVEVLDPASQKWRILDPTEWVAPGATLGRKEGAAKYLAALALLLLATKFIFSLLNRVNGFDSLLAKLEALEDKHRLGTAGLTLSERIARASTLYPEREALMQTSSSLYLSAYFAGEPTPTQNRALAASVAKWGRPQGWRALARCALGTSYDGS